MSEKDFIDEIMGFNPQEVSAFKQDEPKQFTNQNVYKTNPVNSVAEDGHYRSVVRVLYNPFDIKHSIVKQVNYAMHDDKSFFMVKSSLGEGDKSCPIFSAWKKLWFAQGDDVDERGRKCDGKKREWAKQMFDKSESDWALVQVIEDENQANLVGQFKVMKLPRAVMNKLQAKMNPTDPKKAPVPLMDYLFGPALEIDVTPGPDDPKQPLRKQREINYDLCDFGTDPQPIIRTDGTPLFTDEELEVIESYNQANVDLVKAKTEAKRKDAASKKEELTAAVRELYAKAVAYMKENAIDVVDECAYKPWDEHTKARVENWILSVLNMQDPAVGSIESVLSAEPVKPAVAEEEVESDDSQSGPFETPFDDVPF